MALYARMKWCWAGVGTAWAAGDHPLRRFGVSATACRSESTLLAPPGAKSAELAACVNHENLAWPLCELLFRKRWQDAGHEAALPK